MILLCVPSLVATAGYHELAFEYLGESRKTVELLPLVLAPVFAAPIDSFCPKSSPTL